MSDKDVLEVLDAELIIIVDVVSSHKVETVLVGNVVIGVERSVKVANHS